jgi:cytochrome c
MGWWGNRSAPDGWIANPRAVVPGTNMQFVGIADPFDRADVMAFLKRQSD